MLPQWTDGAGASLQLGTGANPITRSSTSRPIHRRTPVPRGRWLNSLSPTNTAGMFSVHIHCSTIPTHLRTIRKDLSFETRTPAQGSLGKAQAAIHPRVSFYMTHHNDGDEFIVPLEQAHSVSSTLYKVSIIHAYRTLPQRPFLDFKHALPSTLP